MRPHLIRRALGRSRRAVHDGLFELGLRATMVGAARGVTSPVRFALDELLLRRTVRRYTLRRSGRTLFLRHPVSDAWVVHEVINRRVYLPPPEVERVLRRVGTPRIVDLGAHIGAATLLLLERFPSAPVVAVEPHPDTAVLLRRTVEANGLQQQCAVLEAAAGVRAGSAAMEGASVLAHLARAGTEEAVDLLPALRKYDVGGDGHAEVQVMDVLPVLAQADLVKMDIEGAEWSILQDPRFAPSGISALVLEYHPQDAPQADTTAAVRGVLGAAGFTVGEPFSQEGGVGLLWAWRG